MKAARSKKSPFFILACVVLMALALPFGAGQARPDINSPTWETNTASGPDEFSPSPALTETETLSPTISPTFTESETPSPPLPPTDTQETPVEQTLLLVGLAENISLQTFARSISHPVTDIGLGALGIYGVHVPQSQADAILNDLSNLPDVRYAEPNHTVTAQDTFPNDPALPFQYALVNIRAPQGWDISTGSNTITIAIVDSGVDLAHPELASKILPGYDFVNGDTDPQDDNGHGTHVAGIAAAASNNGIGMAGVSWGARILPVKVLNAFNSGTYANVAAGIVWATDHGAQVINLSLGGSSPSLTLENAVNYAAGHGVALVAAAGNTGGAILYPARYPAVIAVANTNAANLRVPSSAFGPELDLSAPGAGIYSLAIGGGYTTLGGTSMSAPHVSGALSLLLSLPGVNAWQARSYLESSALDLDAPGWDIYTGHGLIQLDAALLLALPTPTPTSTSTAIPMPVFSTGSKPTSTLVLYSGTNPGHTPSPAQRAEDLPSSSPTVTLTALSFPPASPTVTPTSTQMSFLAQPHSKAGRVPWMPCLGILLILLGLLLAVWAIRARRQR